ncbi:MAG: PIN domain-containing protein [Actinobacteria bacterium 69-20]|nr:PIN domain-containing protein [Actinomycetota bacterium]OJV24913.1 MAG: PIN domain-containing protein [Actinobacteria bacterium 69-20]
MAFAVVYDACVLYPSITRDLLIRVGIERMVRVHWSAEILDEVFRNIVANRPDLDPVALHRTRELMQKALPNAMVSGYEPLIAGIDLPDPDDRHVLAAVIAANAQLIVTDNLKHFPAGKLAPFGVEARGADDFLVDQIHISVVTVRAIVTAIGVSRPNPVSDGQILAEMERSGLIQSAALLRANT